MTQAAAAAAVAAWWLDDGDPAEEEAFARALIEEGCATLPDGRFITGLGWEQLSPIVVTVREGLVVSVSGLPEGVALEVHDHDRSVTDRHGNVIPVIEVWRRPH